MHLTTLSAAAIQLPLLIAATAILLRGPRIVRWLRVMLLGLAWLVLDATVNPMTDAGGLLSDSPVAVAIIAGLLVAIFATAAEVQGSRPTTTGAVAALLVLAIALQVVPAAVTLGLGLAAWVGGSLLLGWAFLREAREHPGSLLEARLRLLAGASWLLAAIGASVLGPQWRVAWVAPALLGWLIIVLAVAPPPFVRLTSSRSRAALRRTDAEIAAVGTDGASALPDVVRAVQTVLGAEAALLIDDDEVAVRLGQVEAGAVALQWLDAGGAPSPTVTVEELDDGWWLFSGDTGRGQLVVVMSPVGVLLSDADREVLGGVAGRLGRVLARDEARRADARAAASLRAAERMRDDMLSTLSHELRTPLATIMGFAELLRSRDHMLSAEQRQDLLDRLVQRGLELELVVSALLDLTSIRGRAVAEHIAPYDLRDLVERALRRAEDDLAGRDIRVDGDELDVHTDGGAILAVLGELLQNVATYTPADAALEVRMLRRGVDAVVEVVDAGPGLGDLGPIDAFAPFVRGGDVMTRATRGVGIGLAIARELAHQLDGSLVADDSGHGTTFTLRFPRTHPMASHGSMRGRSAEEALTDPTLVPSGRRGDVPFTVRPASSVGPREASGGSPIDPDLGPAVTEVRGSG